MSKSPKTQLASAGIGRDGAYGSVATPLYTSSTYLWPSVTQKGPYDYGRTKNPTRDVLCDALVALEGGVGGEVISTGMAAIDLMFNLFNADGLVIAPHDCYGGTHRLLTHRARQNRLRVAFVDMNDEAALDAAFAQNPALVLIETPSNPLMRLTDIKAVCEKAKAVGAITACDNTFLSPVRQKPLELGCDIVLHSTTKYLNGHSDVVGGCVITGNAELAERLKWWANCAGVTGAPFDSWLTVRGLRTLGARMDIQESNAQALAAFLEAHPKVERVYYPGLKSHPQYDLAQTQQSGPGAMLSFEIKTDLQGASDVLTQLEIFQLAASLGGTESLICLPAVMTHGGMEPEARKAAGIGDNLIRISVGMELIDELKSDLDRALRTI